MNTAINAIAARALARCLRPSDQLSAHARLALLRLLQNGRIDINEDRDCQELYRVSFSSPEIYVTLFVSVANLTRFNIGEVWSKGEFTIGQSWQAYEGKTAPLPIEAATAERLVRKIHPWLLGKYSTQLASIAAEEGRIWRSRSKRAQQMRDQMILDTERILQIMHSLKTMNSIEVFYLNDKFTSSVI